MRLIQVKEGRMSNFRHKELECYVCMFPGQSQSGMWIHLAAAAGSLLTLFLRLVRMNSITPGLLATTPWMMSSGRLKLRRENTFPINRAQQPK